MRAAMDAPIAGPQLCTCSRIATRRARKPQSPSPRPAKHDESWLAACDQLLEHGNEVKSLDKHMSTSVDTCAQQVKDMLSYMSLHVTDLAGVGSSQSSMPISMLAVSRHSCFTSDASILGEGSAALCQLVQLLILGASAVLVE